MPGVKETETRSFARKLCASLHTTVPTTFSAKPVISVFVGVTNFIGARFSFGFVQNNGFHQTNGAKQANGAVVNNGFVVDNAIQVENGFTRMNSNYSSPVGFGAIFTGRALRNKGFDIPHPTKKGTRVRHICVEGPESAVYIRGRLTGSNIIELPDYWDGLVDLDTVTISLTQIGYAQDLITEGVKWGKQVYVKSGNGTTIDCYYSIWANRIGPPLHVQYEGESPAETAVRELKEETGYFGKIESVTPPLYTSPGLLSESCFMAFVSIDEEIPQNRFPEAENEPGECIEVIVLEAEKILPYLDDAAEKGDGIDIKLYTYFKTNQF